MSSERMRKNSIASLKTQGMTAPVPDHDQMAEILSASFKNRMGHAQGISMGYDLTTLIQPVRGLEELSQPFSDAKIRKVLQEMPPDRAPGPDGFNGMFVKRCWPIIGKDFLRLIQDFYEGKLSLENINGSHHSHTQDALSWGARWFRPIYLTNTWLKFLTKLLDNKLQKVILNFIHKK